MSSNPTVFGSLEHYEKGGVQVIDDNPKNYVFSNVFEVASKSKPYEKVCVGKNLSYVIEALRAEGTSPWFAADHDEAAPSQRARRWAGSSAGAGIRRCCPRARHTSL